MIQNLFNSTYWYDRMRPKDKKIVQEHVYFTQLFNILQSMFRWEGLPDTCPQRYLDAILFTTGTVAVGEVDGDVICAIPTLGGTIDPYGLGSDVIATTLNGKELRGTRNVDVAWGINNTQMAPDTLMYWIASMMAEIDTSASLNVLYSRLCKIPVVKDDKQKQMVLDTFNAMVNGQFGSIVSKNIMEDGLDDKAEFTLELTDPNKIDKLQYLSRFFDDLLKRFCNIYGQPLQTLNKAAQTQTDELHGMDSFSFIIPLNMLHCRQELCDNINAIFGLNVSVEFSECWEAEYEAFMSRDLNGDGVPGDVLPETSPSETDMETVETVEPESTEAEPEPEETPAQPEDIGEEVVELIEDIVEDVIESQNRDSNEVMDDGDLE